MNIPELIEKLQTLQVDYPEASVVLRQTDASGNFLCFNDIEVRFDSWNGYVVIDKDNSF